MNTLFIKSEVIRGKKVTLEEAILELLPVTGSIEVQRDTPGREHTTHTHPTDETLLVVKGTITFSAEGKSWICHSGDRLLLPAGTLHSSVASDEGCIYIIKLHT